MAFGTIELPEAIPPRLDRPRVMPEHPPTSATPIRLARRLPERPLQPSNQQEDNHHDRPHRQIDQPVIAVIHRLFHRSPSTSIKHFSFHNDPINTALLYHRHSINRARVSSAPYSCHRTSILNEPSLDESRVKVISTERFFALKNSQSRASKP